MSTGIEWTDVTWNPVTGCAKVSSGCLNCYAERMAKRLAGRYGYPANDPFRVTLRPDRLADPLHWRKPKMVFVCSMSDLFHPDVPDEFIEQVWAVMALCPQHTFQVLTKRPERMAEYTARRRPLKGGTMRGGQQLWKTSCDDVYLIVRQAQPEAPLIWPLPNVWLGTSVEDQAMADKRIPELLKCPPAVRFLSIEPLLGSVDLGLGLRIVWQCSGCHSYFSGPHQENCPNCGRRGYWTGSHEFNPPGRQVGSGIDWVIVGGESGPGARPMDPDWARGIRDKCAAAGVQFFFRQWGHWWPGCNGEDRQGSAPLPYGRAVWKSNECFFPIGKKAAGRLLDGHEHNAMPETRT